MTKPNKVSKQEEDDSDNIWLAINGWIAVTTGYIRAEICMYF
jgi:hypothetical protein